MGQPATRHTPLDRDQRVPRARPCSVPARLADVIVLDDHRPRPSRAVYLRRRIMVAAALVVLLAVAGVVLGRLTAGAGPTDAVSGHVVVAPGQTLWDVAVEHAPAGTDHRAYLDQIMQLNGYDGSVQAWEVVLLPAG